MFSRRRLSLLTISAATYSAHGLYSQKAYSEFSLWPKSSHKSSMILPSFSATYDANSPSEDRCIPSQLIKGWNCAAIFDGHGGWQVSEFASKTIFTELDKNLIPESINLSTTSSADEIKKSINSLDTTLIQTFADVEKSYLASVINSFKVGYGEVAKVGCCALVVMKKDSHLLAANCGDCRAILASQSKPTSSLSTSTSSFTATRLTNDHNAREPVEQEKLFREHPNEQDVVRCHPNNPQACYVKGRLQLTRALGDAYLKYKEFNGSPGVHKSSGRHIPEPYTPPYVSYVPEIRHVTLDKSDKFLILATDGVWDFLSDQEAVDLVAGCKDRTKAAARLVDRALEVAAAESGMSIQELRAIPVGSRRRSRHDDTTVVVMYLNDD